MNIKNPLPNGHHRYNKFILQLLGSVTLALFLPQVNAAEVTKDIIINAGIDYDSNPNMVKRNKESVWIYSIAPQLQLGITSELNRWYLDAALLVQRHSNENVLVDREDPRLAIGWDRTYESGIFGIKADYIESSAREDELRSTGVFTKTDNTEKIKRMSANWLYRINPKWSVLTDGSYSDVTFSRPGNLQGYNLGDIKSRLTYAYTERLDTSAELGYSQLQPEKVFDDTEMLRLLMGAAYQVNERLKLGANAGIYDLSGRQSDTDWQAGIKAEYVLDRTSYAAELNRELAPSGVGGFRKVDSIRVGWEHKISEQDQVGANYSLYKARSDKEVNLDWVDYGQLSVFYERRLSRDWKTRLSAAFKEQDISVARSQGNMIGVSLTYDTLSF